MVLKIQGTKHLRFLQFFANVCYEFCDASHEAARDKEVFDAAANVFCEYSQDDLTVKILS